MHRKENNYAFVDSQNLNLSIREQGWNLSFKRFRRYLEDKYCVHKAFIFIGYIATNESLVSPPIINTINEITMGIEISLVIPKVLFINSTIL